MQLDNIWFQDLHTIFERAAFPTALDRHEYHLLDKTFNNKDVFDILTHHILKDMCEEIESTIIMGQKYVIYQNTRWRLQDSEYLPFSPDAMRAVRRLENLIPRIIPAYTIKRPYDIYAFLDKIDNREVEVMDEIEKLKAKIDKNAFRSFNLNKIIKYLDKRGLKYMSTDYFQQANSKLLAANK